jgi:hypothetical protein
MLTFFVRYEAQRVIKEEVLLCDNLTNCTTTNKIFKRLDNVMKDNEIYVGKAQ